MEYHEYPIGPYKRTLYTIATITISIIASIIIVSLSETLSVLLLLIENSNVLLNKIKYHICP